MNNQEAKFILRGYRPGGADATDPRFAEALEQARRDPELAKWMDREQAFDRAVAQKLRAVSIPSGLRETLLAGGRVSKVESPWWRRAAWIGMAASILILLGVVISWPSVQTHVDLAGMSAWAMDDVLHGRHGGHGEEMTRAVASLSDPERKLADFSVSVDQLRRSGCRTLSFAGRDVVEMCFVRSGKEYHLYVTAAPRDTRPPSFVEGKGVNAVAWADGRNSYVLATTGDPSVLRAVL